MTRDDRARVWGRWIRLAVPIAGFVLFAGALWILHRELRSYRYADLVRELAHLPRPRVLLAVALTALSYLALTGYDMLGLSFAGQRLAYRRVALASFVGYAASQSLGFSLLTGAPLRYRFYSRWGVPGLAIAKVVAFCAATLWLGLLAVGGISFVADPLATPAFLHVPVATLRPVGVLLLSLLAGYLAASLAHRRELRILKLRVALPSPRFALAQVALSTVDWLLAAGVLFVLLPPGTVSYPAFLGVFVLAQLAGLVSSIPGGLGVFESVVLLFLTPGLAAPEVIGILLAFRGIYYLMPLGLAAVVLVAYEGRRIGRHPAVAPITQWASSWVPHVMAGLVFLAGVILLASGATPADGSRLQWLNRIVPVAVIEVSHLLASAIGVGLLLLARGLQLRLDAALHLTLAMLFGGIVFSLAKGLDWEEASALGLVLVAVWASRREFYRRAAILEERFSPGWIVAVLIVLLATTWLGFFAFKHVEYRDSLWWHFGRDAQAPRFLRATVGAVVVLGAVAAARLLRPARLAPTMATPDDLEDARGVIARSDRSEANLALLGDKALLFNETRTAFLMYGRERRSWVSMGDPIGSPEEQRELAWRFREMCEVHAAWPVFYEVPTESLPMYLDMGLTLTKAGEEARVPLEAFSLEGGSRKGLRQTVHRVEKTGAYVEVLPADAVARLLPELRAVSDAWLSDRKTAEKGFSMGRFEEGYLTRFPVAVVRQGERIVAFANLWPAAAGTELSVDLMRHTAEAPQSVMEYLFIRVMLWASEQGYRWFSLGMAPLSGLEGGRDAPLWHRLGGFVFRHGEHFYNFQGLRRYKEKFDPVWEPRYLASPGGFALPRILIHVSTLISGGLTGIVRR